MIVVGWQLRHVQQSLCKLFLFPQRNTHGHCAQQNSHGSILWALFYRHIFYSYILFVYSCTCFLRRLIVLFSSFSTPPVAPKRSSTRCNPSSFSAPHIHLFSSLSLLTLFFLKEPSFLTAANNCSIYPQTMTMTQNRANQYVLLRESKYNYDETIWLIIPLFN